MNLKLHDPALRLAEAWQRGFPLCPRPFARIGRAHELSEGETIELFRDLADRGVLARIGAAVRPNTAGASTLAALSTGGTRLDEIAAMVSAEPAVTHNYRREHAIDLWFVVTAADRPAVDATLARIGRASGREVLDLPLERAYHIDLGFRLSGRGGPKRHPSQPRHAVAVDDSDRHLLSAIRDGFALVPRPFGPIARLLGCGERDVIERLETLEQAGVISRLGCILRHRRIGITANAMAVWDVPEAAADSLGERLARSPAVTLCYRRRRQLPAWPYNLFAMIHGREQGVVERQIAEAARDTGLSGYPTSVLFSTRCFKQEGAHFGGVTREAA